LLILTKRKSNS